MASAGIYEDDDSINNLLDNLIATGTAAPADDHAPAFDLASHHDPIFTADNLPVAVKSVNALLHDLSLGTPLPPLARPSDDPAPVLAAALTALARLARGAAANRALRTDAESAARGATSEIDRLTTALAAARERAASAKDTAVGARRDADEARRTGDAVSRRAAADAADARTKLAGAARREKALVMDAKRRDREYAQLQRRLHTVVEAAHGRSILQTVTVTPGRAVEAARAAVAAATGRPEGAGAGEVGSAGTVDGEVTETFEELALSAEGECIDVVVQENERFRELLRAVQEELDDVLVMHNSQSRKAGAEVDDPVGKLMDDNGDVSEDEHGDIRADNPGALPESEVSDTDADAGNDADSASGIEKSENATDLARAGSESESFLDGVTPAPTEEQMRLPFDVIREDFEQSLEQKFSMIREALSDQVQ